MSATQRQHAQDRLARLTTESDAVLGMAQATIDHWTSWLRRSTYVGRWREVVQRSAITLRLLTYAPTGALVAAPTVGLPELPPSA